MAGMLERREIWLQVTSWANTPVPLEPITGTTTWGETLEEAQAMIIKALELYFEEVAAEQIPDTQGVVFGFVAVHTKDAAA